jgi:hypothetical protein
LQLYKFSYFLFHYTPQKNQLFTVGFYFLLVISSFIYRKVGTLCGAELGLFLLLFTAK